MTHAKGASSPGEAAIVDRNHERRTLERPQDRAAGSIVTGLALVTRTWVTAGLVLDIVEQCDNMIWGSQAGIEEQTVEQEEQHFIQIMIERLDGAA